MCGDADYSFPLGDIVILGWKGLTLNAPASKHVGPGQMLYCIAQRRIVQGAALPQRLVRRVGNKLPTLQNHAAFDR